MPRTREEILSLLEDQAKVWRGMATQYLQEANEEKQNWPGSFWQHMSKATVYNTTAEALENIIRKENK